MGLPTGSLDSVVSEVLPHYTRADRLAVIYQKKHTRAVNGVLYLAAASVTIAVGQVLFFPTQAGSCPSTNCPISRGLSPPRTRARRACNALVAGTNRAW